MEKLDQNLQDTISSHSSHLKNLDYDKMNVSLGVNLFDKENVLENCYINSVGYIAQNTTDGYFVSDVMKVKPETTYSTNYNCGAGYCAFYDKDFKIISTAALELVTGSKIQRTVTSPKNAYYCRSTYLKASYNAPLNQAMFVEGNILPTHYIPYSVKHDVDLMENKAGSINAYKHFIGIDEKITITTNLNPHKGSEIGLTCYTDNQFFGPVIIKHGEGNIFSSARLEISATDVKVYKYDTSDGELVYQANHGLDFTSPTSLSVIIDKYDLDKAKFTISTKSGTFVFTANWEGCRGNIEVENGTRIGLWDVYLTYYVRDLNKKIWGFGDSYFDMWPKQIEKMGFDDWYINGFGGARSSDGLSSLKEALEYKTPSVVMWCLGMNDPDNADSINAQWLSDMEEVINLCNKRKITLIIQKIPNTPTHLHTFKNDYINNLNFKFIPIPTALNATEANATWYAGLLSSDNLHPSERGQVVIASCFASFVPELCDVENRTFTTKLNHLDGVDVDEKVNIVAVKKGWVSIRFEGTIKTALSNGEAFLGIDSIYSPNLYNRNGSRLPIFGVRGWEPATIYIDEMGIFMGGNTEAGTTVIFNTTYYIGERNYEDML